MPYLYEHAVQYHNHDPERYKRYRRENNELGDGIHVIYGILRHPTKTKHTEIQAIRLDNSMYSIKDVKSLVGPRGGLRELGKPLKIEPALDYRNNPAENDLQTYITYFINEEKKGIAEYKKFLKFLARHPKYHRLAFLIKGILEDELRHIQILDHLN